LLRDGCIREKHYAGEQILAGQLADLESHGSNHHRRRAIPEQIVAEIRKRLALSKMRRL